MLNSTFAAVVVLMLAGGPALAGDNNYNSNSAGTNNNGGGANCHSATMLSGCTVSSGTVGCSPSAIVEAPLPLAGEGALGAVLMAIAGLGALALRRGKA